MFGHPKEDTVAGIVVFLVAVPLCLGIAIACGVPPLSGLIAGIVGGLVVPFMSRSALSVTGPAAGLTSVVLVELQRLGGIAPFLTAVIIAGFLQLLLGVLRSGRFAALVPSSVIKGMLAAIGITIIYKQIPVALGVTGGYADLGSELHTGATLIAAVSLLILYGWKHTPFVKFKLLSPALVVRYIADDIKALYAEAAQAIGPQPSMAQLNGWFWGKTIAADFLRALRTAAIASKHTGFNTAGSRFIVPAPFVEKR